MTYDCETLAAIIFVTMAGRTWGQLPSVSDPSEATAHRRFTDWTSPGYGPNCTE